jgi:hypothetical protein
MTYTRVLKLCVNKNDYNGRTKDLWRFLILNKERLNCLLKSNYLYIPIVLAPDNKNISPEKVNLVTPVFQILNLIHKYHLRFISEEKNFSDITLRRPNFTKMT